MPGLPLKIQDGTRDACVLAWRQDPLGASCWPLSPPETHLVLCVYSLQG